MSANSYVVFKKKNRILHNNFPGFLKSLLGFTMKTTLFLKAMLLMCSSFFWLSCSSWEEVVSPAEFLPVKIISVSPESAGVGDEIVITGEKFLKNKDFDQVWFGGNVRGKVDSATATKLFLKVPDGAQTGAISVSNGIYADTLKSDFKIVKESLFKTASIKFNGIKYIQFHQKIIYSRPNGSGYSGYDTIIVQLHRNIVRTKIPGNVYLRENCCSAEGPYPDSVIQRYEYNGKDTYYYDIVSLSVDSINNIVDSLTLSFYDKTKRYSSANDRFERCLHTRIRLQNVPYKVIDGKTFLELNSDDLKTCLKNYTYGASEFQYASSPSSSDYDLYITGIGIYEILPDAHFELTLE